MKDLTFVIPMYNEEKNISNCVQILRNQTKHNFDVCFIDDGSSDNTLTILSDLLKDDITFDYTIFQQKNSGAAAARKKGIELAKSKYVAMIDCDDSIAKNYVEKIISIIKSNSNVDMIIPNMKVQNADGTWHDFVFYTEDLILQNSEAIKNTFAGWKIHGIMCIKREIFLKSYEVYYKFNGKKENFINNDEVITRINFMLSTKILRSDTIYYYHYNSESTTRKVNEKKYLMLENMLIMKSLFENIDNIKDNFYKDLVDWTWGTYRYLVKFNKFLTNTKDWKNMLIKTINDISYSDAFKHISLEHKVKLVLLKEIIIRKIK